MNKEFQVHKLNKTGMDKAITLSKMFDLCLETIKQFVPEGRELSLVKTKLEEASFFSKKGMANQKENQDE